MPDNGGKRLKEEYETIDLLEILRLLKKNLLAILAVTILLAVAGYLERGPGCCTSAHYK